MFGRVLRKTFSKVDEIWEIIGRRGILLKIERCHWESNGCRGKGSQQRINWVIECVSGRRQVRRPPPLVVGKKSPKRFSAFSSLEFRSMQRGGKGVCEHKNPEKKKTMAPAFQVPPSIHPTKKKKGVTRAKGPRTQPLTKWPLSVFNLFLLFLKK